MAVVEWIFGELSHDVSRRLHWFLFFRGRSYKSQIYKTNDSGLGNDDNDYSEGYLFDPYEKKWYQLTFPFLPPGFSPRSSSSGIVIWVSDKAGPKQFIVANPIAMMFTYLPPTQTSRMCPSIGLVATDSSFYVMVAGEDMPSQFSVKNLTTESFLIDSVANYYFPWDITSALPNLYNSESTRMVFVEGRFYCMNYSPFGIWSYDIATNQWNKIQTPMHRHLRSPSLVECRGRLLLVAAVEKAKLKVQRGMRLWGLQDETWDEVDKMPQQLYEEFEAVENNNGFDCVGHGDFITITILGSDKVLLFDFRQKVWEWVPQCPYVPPYGSGGGELHGFAYEPRLTTPVMNQLAILPPN
ncbi:hypothetical protein IFM89_004469 [Coptis chinensis]|uniref:KIB1-4 beta-propeller domain-containing protein n=1 Tax=Coptis chinensis TaxID=261450 RepID=A0A835GXD5_9MAGN|nr:hypothetical protein IFM89_004469 [Coptis chinensis]